jgi:hypothetical protein
VTGRMPGLIGLSRLGSLPVRSAADLRGNHPSGQRRSALQRPRGMTTMRAGATGAAFLALVVATACGTSSRPAQSSSAPGPTAVSAAASPSTGSAPGSSPPAAVRPGFAASDVSFVLTQRGWVLGSGQLLATDDGALSWTALPAPRPG